MGEKFLDFAAVNPLGAAVVIAAVAGLVVAAGYSAIPLSKLVRAARSKNGNGHTEELPKVVMGQQSGPVAIEDFNRHVEGDQRIHEDLEDRIKRYENLTNAGARLEAHFKRAHDDASVLTQHGSELKHGGRRITALEGEVKGLREDFAEHRGDVCARLEGLETGQQTILTELRKLGASAS